jgi:hypothetical protein
LFVGKGADDRLCETKILKNDQGGRDLSGETVAPLAGG